MSRRAIALFRAIRLACHLVYGALLAIVYPLCTLRTRQALLQQWSRELLEILHIRLEISGYPPLGTTGSLLVANHISWLDVFAINALVPSCFIAKSEVRSWPLLGMLCRRARTVFIERDIRRDTLRINRQIGALFTEGESVALFPEGTSTDGTQLRHFHSSLFQSAIDSQAPVQPIAIRYHDGTGQYSHAAAFIGDMNFAQSLRNILFAPTLHVTLILLPALSCAGENRRTLASKTQAAIGAVLTSHAALHPPASTEDLAAPASAFRSAYSLLLDPVFRLSKRHSG